MRKSKLVQLLESDKLQHHLSYQARKRDNELVQRCVRCPNTVEDGHVCCQDCRKKMAQGKKQALEQGLCIDCWTEPALPGKRYCQTHQTQRQRKHAARYTQRLVRSRCVRCGQKQTRRTQGTLTLCKACATQNRAWVQHCRQRKRQIAASATAAV